MTQPIDFEYYLKCLLVMNDRGVYLTSRDGHTWIDFDPECENNWNYDFAENGIYLNNKIYGGVFEAIDTFDEAIQRMGEEPLIKQFYFYFGRRGVAENRIEKVGRGRGGIM